MGVGRTVYKGEVETGVFAWFCSGRPFAGQSGTAQSLWERRCGDPTCSRRRCVSQHLHCWYTLFASRLAPTGFVAPKL